MNSHLTAIARKALPTPVQALLRHDWILGHVLDFGCGKCAEVNAKFLNTAPGVGSVVSYDPHYAPDALKKSKRKKFDTVLCTYVLCTLPEEKELEILHKIQSLLTPTGLAFITVRNDVPKQGFGRSSRGTYQRKVELPFLCMWKKTSQYRIYVLTFTTVLPK